MRYLSVCASVFVLFVSVAPVGVKAFVLKDSDLQIGKNNLEKPPLPQSPSQDVQAPTEFERTHANLKPAPPRSSEKSS